MQTLVDTHCHLDYIQREGLDAEAVLNEAKVVGLKWLLNPGTHPDYFGDIIKLAERFENVYAAFSVHPTDVQETDETIVFDVIDKLLAHSKVKAVGETGLDYYHDATHKEQQKRYFEKLIQLAEKHQLPIIIHCRDKNDCFEAFEDTLTLVKKYPAVKGIMHCFGGNPEYAKQFAALGFYISFAGNLTFKKATQLHDSAIAVPIESILIETDSPFLSPDPFRGKYPNVPERVQFVAQKLAELKNLSVDDVRNITTQNAEKLFNISC